MTADYNGARQAFLAVLVARAFGFGEEKFWELGAEERPAISTAPKVKF